MPNVVDAMTERLLADAGIRRGMRVLDVGCGGGFVSLMAARLVGSTGQVLGIDRSAAPLKVAEELAVKEGLRNTRFEQRDLADARSAGEFDAVIGRRVLLYQPDPVQAIRQAVAPLRSGGIAIFQEHDATPLSPWQTPLPLHQQVHQWLWDTVTREGANIHMGYDLAGAVSKAGLILQHVRAEAIVQTPELSYPTHEIVRAVLPRIVQEGIATEKQIDVDTLGDRLREERVRAGATYLGELVFGVWGTK